MERQLRRYQNLLICVGTGIIMFGFWSLIKGVLFMFLYKDELREFLVAVGTTEEELGFAIPIIYIVFGVLIMIDLSLRMIVGSSARKEGRGQDGRNRFAHLIVGVILAIMAISFLIGDIYNFEENFRDIFDGIVTTAIDVTSVVMVVELFVAGVKVKYLKKKIGEAKREEIAA